MKTRPKGLDVVTQSVAQVMTRGKVKSKFISESEWVICSQPSGVPGGQFIDYKVVGFKSGSI